MNGTEQLIATFVGIVVGTAISTVLVRIGTDPKLATLKEKLDQLLNIVDTVEVVSKTPQDDAKTGKDTLN